MAVESSARWASHRRRPIIGPEAQPAAGQRAVLRQFLRRVRHPTTIVTEQGDDPLEPRPAGAAIPRERAGSPVGRALRWQNAGVSDRSPTCRTARPPSREAFKAFIADGWAPYPTELPEPLPAAERGRGAGGTRSAPGSPASGW